MNEMGDKQNRIAHVLIEDRLARGNKRGAVFQYLSEGKDPNATLGKITPISANLLSKYPDPRVTYMLCVAGATTTQSNVDQAKHLLKDNPSAETAWNWAILDAAKSNSDLNDISTLTEYANAAYAKQAYSAGTFARHARAWLIEGALAAPIAGAGIAVAIGLFALNITALPTLTIVGAIGLAGGALFNFPFLIAAGKLQHSRDETKIAKLGRNLVDLQLEVKNFPKQKPQPEIESSNQSQKDVSELSHTESLSFRKASQSSEETESPSSRSSAKKKKSKRPSPSPSSSST